jgi:hypothetical protein
VFSVRRDKLKKARIMVDANGGVGYCLRSFLTETAVSKPKRKGERHGY